MIIKNLSSKHMTEARKLMRALAPSHIDECGELNCTALAEEVAATMDIYENSDYGIHDDIFELATEFAA